LRREIETALENQRNIVPLMLEEFDFNAPAITNQLTGTLATLKNYNGLRIPPDYFDEAMDRLRNRHLNVPLTAVRHPTSPSVERAASEQKAAANAAAPVQEEELTAQQWFERGFAATDQKEQIRLFGLAIRLKPDYATASYNRAAVRLEPDFALAYYKRGHARRKIGDVVGAVEDSAEARRLGFNT
jgi:hypothetical protein